MPIFGLLLSVAAFIIFWWFRARRLGEAADTVIDLAGRAKGAYSRNRFRNKANASVLTGVTDPRTAAATLLYGLVAMKQPVSLFDEDKIDAQLETVCMMSARERQEAMAFAAWASGQVADVNEIVRRFVPLWLNELREPQRKELVDMALDVAEIGGPPTAAQGVTIRRLSEGLFGVK